MKREVEYPIGPSIAYVPLTQGLYALIDADDAERVGHHNWHAAFNKTSRRFYARKRAGGGRLPLHSFVLGKEEGKTVDHISRDSLDNRKCNLRMATASLQAWNRGMLRSNTSGHVGIFWEKKKSLWRALIIHKNKRIGLGRYKEKEEAIKAYEMAARKLRTELCLAQ